MTLLIEDNEQTALISTSQTLTDSWANLGDVIDTRDQEAIALWLKVDINNSQNFRLRVLAKQTSASSDLYSLPIKTSSSSDVKLEAEYYELNVDSDINIVLDIGVGDLVQFIQVQVMVGTVGVSAGAITSAKVSGSLKG